MDKAKENLQGSLRRDIFKRCHKKLHKSFYCSDADLCLIDKYPPGIVAYLDYKMPTENITFSEVILYNEWLISKPVYIIRGTDPENGPFTIYEYLGGDWNPDPPKVHCRLVESVSGWMDYWKWEYSIRREYRQRHRSNGKESDEKTMVLSRMR